MWTNNGKKALLYIFFCFPDDLIILHYFARPEEYRYGRLKSSNFVRVEDLGQVSCGDLTIFVFVFDLHDLGLTSYKRLLCSCEQLNATLKFFMKLSFLSLELKGTFSPAQNRLKVVWLDRLWLGHPSLFFNSF